MSLQLFIILAGVGQIVLACGSLAIPRILGWRSETEKLRPLLRQMFWTYGAYIWCINLSFGLLSTFASSLLTDGSRLAGIVSGFIAVYWGARVVIQFAYFDRRDAPKGTLYVWAETALVLLFVSLTLVYSAASVIDLKHQ